VIVKIFCNANVYISIAKGEYPKDVIETLWSYKESGSLQIFWIPTNFYEIIQGITNEKDFQIAKTVFATMMNLTDGKMFPDYKVHVQKAVCRRFELEEPPWDDRFLNSAKKLFEATSYNDIREKLKKWQDYAKKGVQEPWVADTERVAAELSKIHKENIDTVDDALFSAAEPVLWPAIKQRFEIETYVKDLPSQDVLPKVPALWFWFSISIGYYRKLGVDGRKPISSDLIDLEQMIYLDETNFFVFEDAKFESVLSKAFWPEMGNLCIGLTEFIEMLRIKLPI